MLNNGAMVADRYRLQRLIATGGMGQVWAATDMRLDRRVAVKVLKSEFSADPTFRLRFHSEAKTTALLNHPGIAGIYDYGETLDVQGARTAYLVMELVQGEPLNTVLERLGRLSINQALDMLEQTGRALQVAHDAGVVHRDVKPGNILVTPTGMVKITDFGIAKAVDASPVTKTGMVMGTAQYIAPEQALGEEATAASDVYSLGVVGYEALAGRRPFAGDGALTVAMKHVRESPEPMPLDVPAPVRELIDITMTKDPAARYGDGGEFADAVAAVRVGLRPPAPMDSAGRRSSVGPVAPARGISPTVAGTPLPPTQRNLSGTSTGYTDARSSDIVAAPPRSSGLTTGQKVLAGLGGGALIAAVLTAGWLLVSNQSGGSDYRVPPVTTTTTQPTTAAPTPVPVVPPISSTYQYRTTTVAPTTTSSTTVPTTTPRVTTTTPPTTTNSDDDQPSSTSTTDEIPGLPGFGIPGLLPSNPDIPQGQP